MNRKESNQQDDQINMNSIKYNNNVFTPQNQSQEFELDASNFKGLQQNHTISVSKDDQPQHENEQEANGFFITGVNNNDQKKETVQQNDIDEVDSYKHIAIVDCSKAFSFQECVHIHEKQKSVTYLNESNLIQFKFDTLVTGHNQVERICSRLAEKFISPTQKCERDKIVMNISDQFNCNNNAGFNLTNFKIQYINQYYDDIVNDYENSFIGTFTKSLLQKLKNENNKQLEIYFTITKFQNDIGYSLMHQNQSIQDASEQNKTQSPKHMESFQMSEKNLSPMQATFQNQSPQEENQKEKRKALLTQHGVLPEFVRVQEIYHVYTAFTQANIKNSILCLKELDKESDYSESAILLGQKEFEIKDEIILMQFKLVENNKYKTLNTLSFLNLPLKKSQDINVSTLIDVVTKLKKNSFNQQSQNGKKKLQNDFIPFRKSILTRLLQNQLQKMNFLVLSHFSKQSLKLHFKNGTGPAKGIFSQIDQMFGDLGDDMELYQKKKLNDQQALKILQQKFKKETHQIFKQIEQFRDGQKSMEVFSKQNLSMYTQNGSSKNGILSSLFLQIIQFLNLQDELQQGFENGNQGQFVMKQNFTNEALEVLFDQDYVRFNELRAKDIFTEGYTSFIGKNKLFNKSKYGTSADTQVSQLRHLFDPIKNFQMNKIQHVQYECIKTELKEEYEKKIKFLDKKLESNKNQSGPYKDVQQILSINKTSINENLIPLKIKREGAKSSANIKREKSFQLPEMDLIKYGNSQIQNSQISTYKNMGGKKKSIDDKQEIENQNQDYYRFYLESAQKAIEIMRNQHNSALNIKIQNQSKQSGIENLKRESFQPLQQHSKTSLSKQKEKENILNQKMNQKIDNEIKPQKPKTVHQKEQRSKQSLILEPLFVNINRLSKARTNLNQNSGSLDGDKKSEYTNQKDSQTKQNHLNNIIDPFSITKTDIDKNLIEIKPLSESNFKNRNQKDENYGTFSGGNRILSSDLQKNTGLLDSNKYNLYNFNTQFKRGSGFQLSNKSQLKSFQPLRKQGMLNSNFVPKNQPQIQKDEKSKIKEVKKLVEIEELKLKNQKNLMKLNNEYIQKQLVQEVKPNQKHVKFVTGQKVMEKLQERIKSIVFEKQNRRSSFNIKGHADQQKNQYKNEDQEMSTIITNVQAPGELSNLNEDSSQQYIVNLQL